MLLTGRTLHIVQRIAQTAERIGAHDLSQRLEASGGDEFARLSETFNRMLGRLETAFAERERLLEQQKRFVADASHEVQTPLAVMKANTSLTLGADASREDCLLALQEIDAAVDSMSQLVQDLLLLARSDASQLGRYRVSLPLQGVFRRAVARVKRRPSAPISLAENAEEICIEANEEELVRLFVNLLENAQRYTPPEGEIRISVRQEAENAIVVVSDTGVGIAPEHLPHLGERFYRADASRARSEGGTGLGLSICRNIAEAHGGSLAIESVVGVGTTIIVSLPVSHESS
jgi:signal transduction histidine kinase